MRKPRDRSTDGPIFKLGEAMEVQNPPLPSIEYANFTDAHIWGARIMLMKMMAESRQDWTSAGFRHWAETQIQALATLEDELTPPEAA